MARRRHASVRFAAAVAPHPGPAPLTRYPAPGTRHPVPGTRYPFSLTGKARLERGQVHPLDVLLQHAARAEAGRHDADGLLDHLYPTVRHVVRVAVIERGHHFGLEQAVERLGVCGVLSG